MASFDGASIFGRAVTMTTVLAPRAEQRNEFFGIDGIEALDGGSRGGTTIVSGVLYEADLATLVTAWNAFLAKKDGLTHALVDTEGTTHPEAKLMSVEPKGPLRRDQGGKYLRAYTARFDHLI